MKTALLSAAFLFFSLASSAQTITLSPLPKTDFCLGDTMTVQYSATGTFIAGNQFVVQLSTDSFQSWTVIGRDTKASGQILATFGTAGTGYRIRVVSTNPITQSNDNGLTISVNSPPDIPNMDIISQTWDYEPFFESGNDWGIPDMAGDTLHLMPDPSSPKGLFYSWHFDNDATLLTPLSHDSIALVYPTAGLKNGTVTVSNATCEGPTGKFSFEIFDCHPIMHSRIHVVTGTESGNYDSVLVKSGGQYTGGNVVFVEAGGSAIVLTSVHSYYFVKRGGSITVPDGPYWDYVFADSGVSVTIPEDHDGLTVFHCNDLEFGITIDTAFTMNRVHWDAGALPLGSSDSVYLLITNKSDTGVTFVGNVGSPTDPAFTIPSGGGAFSIAEKASHSFWVVYHSDGKAHNTSLLVQGPRPQDTIRVSLSSEAYVNAVVEAFDDQSISIRQLSSHLFVRSDGVFSLRLMNILGAEVTRTQGEKSLDFDLSQLMPGVYFAVVESNGSREIQKIIVSK